MAQVQKQLGDVLFERGLVTPEQLSFATQQEAKTGESAWKILMDRGVVTERDLVRCTRGPDRDRVRRRAL